MRVVEMAGEPPLGSSYLDVSDYSIVLVACSLTSDYALHFFPFRPLRFIFVISFEFSFFLSISFPLFIRFETFCVQFLRQSFIIRVPRSYYLTS